MGYTKIFPIKVTVENAISYIKEDKFEELNEDVLNEINYAQNDKSENSFIFKTTTSYIGCREYVKGATEDFEKTRNYFDKNDGNLAFHLIQSFSEHPSEVDANLIHKIGMELAIEVFSGFQVVVSTHTNTKNIHNHFVINAVGIDGKRWNDCDKTKQLIRNASDKLCEKYGLKTLENTKNYQRYYNVNRNENTHLRTNNYRTTEKYDNENKKTNSVRSRAKNTIDSILPFCNSYEELLDKLKSNGWQIKDKNKYGVEYKYLSFKLPFTKKYIREYQVGDEYKRDNIKTRILENFKLKEEDLIKWENKFTESIENGKLDLS